MRAILLVGGLGTRLRPLTSTRPKALMPVLNRPFLSYLLDSLGEENVTEIILAAGHQAKPLTKHFPKLRHAIEPEPLGTGGAIRFAFEKFRKKNDPSPVLIFNGDVLFDLSLKEFIEFHDAKKSQCTIALKKMADPTAFGVVQIDSKGRINNFIEKPHSFRSAALINAGVYAIAPHLIKKIPLGKTSSVEKEFFPALLSAGVPAYGFVSTGYWNDIGTPQTYSQAHRDLLSIKNSWTEKYFFRKRAHELGPNSTLFLGNKTQVSKSAKIKGLVFCGDRVKIGAGAEVENSILFNGVTIGKGARVEDAVLGSGCVIEQGVAVPRGSILGDKTKIKRHSK